MFIEKMENNTLLLLGAFEYPHFSYMTSNELAIGKKVMDESAIVIKINRNVNVYNVKQMLNYGTIEIDNV